MNIDAPENVSSPLFSVVTVCYNDLANLQRTADSVMHQSFSNFEWLIIDGGSKDGTRQWLEELSFERARWISEKDNGIFHAMNKGCSLASGRFLVFMNSGDLFADAETLARVADVVTSHPEAVLLYGDSIDVGPSGVGQLRRARAHTGYRLGMFAQHQAMFFRASEIRYRENLPITADYAYIGEHIQSARQPSELISLDFPVCRFLLGGLNEKARFSALREDFRTRVSVFGMSFIQASALYVAHYVHTFLKRFSPTAAMAFRR